MVGLERSHAARISVSPVKGVRGTPGQLVDHAVNSVISERGLEGGGLYPLNARPARRGRALRVDLAPTFLSRDCPNSLPARPRGPAPDALACATHCACPGEMRAADGICATPESAPRAMGADPQGTSGRPCWPCARWTRRFPPPAACASTRSIRDLMLRHRPGTFAAGRDARLGGPDRRLPPHRLPCHRPMGRVPCRRLCAGLIRIVRNLRTFCTDRTFC